MMGAGATAPLHPRPCPSTLPQLRRFRSRGSNVRCRSVPARAVFAVALPRGPGFVHYDAPAVQFGTVKRRDCPCGLVPVADLHEAEATRAPGFAIRHDPAPHDLCDGGEGSPQVLLRGTLAQVADVQCGHQFSSSLELAPV